MYDPNTITPEKMVSVLKAAGTNIGLAKKQLEQ